MNSAVSAVNCDSGRAAAAGARFPGSLFYAGPWHSQAQRFVPSCASATSNSMGKPLKSAAKAKAKGVVDPLAA
ncbi:MAG: hypothetical protein E6471_33030, partial [Bradyrhizobium sp.]|nr:hypothetical protein [Bradyrhizobium sp.]